ncbi:SCO4225 family membrane protein [Actinokineospora soli]|uniref:SCO4225 family membrane protein n=1 Tax=Actinokineospora soli TaxID=1048753 RepID=A0ABW2TKP1_9PSEU
MSEPTRMSLPARIALIYLALVYTVYLLVIVVMAVDEPIGASFMPIWAFLAALPGSALVMPLGDSAGPAVAIIGLVLVPPAQALVIYWIARAVDRGRRSTG